MAAAAMSAAARPHTERAMTIIIYHNPKCSTSRNVLGALRDAGHDPHIVEYLKTPPTKEELKDIVAKMDATLKDIVRTKEPIYQELNLDKPGVTDEQLLEAMVEHPVLINRPIVIKGETVKLCRPAETVKVLL
jgi:arsenate reductase